MAHGIGPMSLAWGFCSSPGTSPAPMSMLPTTIPFVFASLLPCLSLAAQTQIYTLQDTSTSNLGVSSKAAGDVDQDGYPDMFVGASRDGTNGVDAGMARLYSGREGKVLATFFGDAAGDNFGNAVSSAGDVNGDGFVDLLVGAPGDDNAGSLSGSARVFSGIWVALGTGLQVLYTFDGDAVDDHLGFAVSAGGDLNADGYSDLLAAANGGATSVGYARVYSGKDGATLHTVPGDTSAVCDISDLNADSYPDFIVGLGRLSQASSVNVYSGKNGALIYNLPDDSLGDNLGFSLSAIGDANQDGLEDFIAGAPQVGGKGYARVFSGKDGSTIRTHVGDAANDLFGLNVSRAGDVNGDTYTDVIVGAPGLGALPLGYARVYSGKDGSQLLGFTGTAAGEAFGGSVSSTDVNADGTPDLMVGSVLAGVTMHGALHVFSGTPLSLSTDTHVMSVGVASSQNLSIDAGVGNAFANYWVFTNFALSGNSPGVTMTPGVVIPLNSDVLTSFVISLTQLGGGGPTFAGWKGTLNAAGKASASLNTFGPVPVLVGDTLNHAALIYTANGCGLGCDTFQMATNWVPMTTVP